MLTHSRSQHWSSFYPSCPPPLARSHQNLDSNLISPAPCRGYASCSISSRTRDDSIPPLLNWRAKRLCGVCFCDLEPGVCFSVVFVVLVSFVSCFRSRNSFHHGFPWLSRCAHRPKAIAILHILASAQILYHTASHREILTEKTNRQA